MRASVGRAAFETLEGRSLMAADTLPVLLVIADRQDFYYREYGDTRQAIEASGLEVQVAATTTNRSVPHPGTGEPAGTDGGVTPDVALAQVNAADYSAIVFVGGWGSSMYQYAYNDPNLDGVTDNYYVDGRYNGDDDLNDGRMSATKVVVNDLINEFLADDKPVAAICHGVTVLAWARVDGVSPLAGKTVSVPWVGAPATFYDGQWYGYFGLSQYEQVVENGAVANAATGAYGDPHTATDDVVVDGRIITAENYDSASRFGFTIAAEVLASGTVDDPPNDNQPPTIIDQVFSLDENSLVGALVGQADASDLDAGQTLTYSLVGGNVGGAFAIDAATGEIRVANAAALDFETTPVFHLQVVATDDGSVPLSDAATITVQLRDVLDLAPGSAARWGNDVIVRGLPTSEWIYVWSGATANEAHVWVDGRSYGPFMLPQGGRVIVYGDHGNDQIFATDARMPVTLYGEEGYDLIVGGSASDVLDGGSEGDRIVGGAGDDLIVGGHGADCLYGGVGADVLVGGDGDDRLEGQEGRDLLIGGAGADYLLGAGGEDLLVGGRTSYDRDVAALFRLYQAWNGPGTLASRSASIGAGVAGGTRLVAGETVFDDGVGDVLCGGGDADWIFASGADWRCEDPLDLLA